MSKLGFAIGKGLNLGVKFAAGAGALDMIGKGNKAASVVKDFAGIGSNVDAGASLSDRIRGGLSSVSPKFAYAENVKSQIEQRGIQTDLDKEKLDTFRKDQAEIDVKKATLFDPMSLLGEDMQANPRMQKHMQGLMKMAGSDLDGDGKTSQWEWEQVQERINTDGTLQQGVIRIMDSEIDFADKNIATIKGQAGDLVTKYNTSKEGVAMSPSNDKYVTLNELREMANDPQVAGTLDKKLLESIHQLDVTEQMKGKFQQGRETALMSMSMTNQKLQADTVLAEAKALSEVQSLEGLEGKIGLPEMKFARQLKQDFNANTGIKDYKKVRTQYGMMDATIKRVLSGESHGNIATDQALINIFNKILDPLSVVRESEFDRTGRGAALREMLAGYKSKVIDGGVALTNESRTELVEQAQLMMQEYEKWAGEEAADAIDFARKAGFNPSLIVGEGFSAGGDFEAEADSILGGG